MVGIRRREGVCLSRGSSNGRWSSPRARLGGGGGLVCRRGGSKTAKTALTINLMFGDDRGERWS